VSVVRREYFFEVVLYIFDTDPQWYTLEENLAASLDYDGS